MSVIIEKNLLAHIFYNPDIIERTSLNGEHFSDIVCRGLYTKLKQKHEESGGYEFINKELLPLLYENNKSIFEVKGIQSFREVPKYIFSEYDRQSSFDWMYSENILREQFRKRQYSEVFERALEEIEESNIDTVRSNLDMKLSSLDKEDPKDSSIVQGNSFLDMYNTRTKEIDELRKSKKPTHYTPSHPVAQKYARMKKGWFCNIISGSGGGKSLALCQEAVHHSKVYDERVLFITDENSDEVILTYMYCNYLGLKYHEVEDRKIDLDDYISNLPEEEKKEITRVFTNIDVIELSGIPTVEVRNMLSNARNLDNPYGWVGIDSFDEMNIDANLDDFTRQNQNAIMCERIAKDYSLILWVTSQLKTDYYTISIEKMPMTANHGAKTLIKKGFLSIILWWEFSKDEDGDQTQLGFRGKINKCRSGGMGKIYEIEQNYNYCQLIASEIEIGEGLSSEDTF